MFIDPIFECRNAIANPEVDARWLSKDYVGDKKILCGVRSVPMGSGLQAMPTVQLRRFNHYITISERVHAVPVEELSDYELDDLRGIAFRMASFLSSREDACEEAMTAARKLKAGVLEAGMSAINAYISFGKGEPGRTASACIDALGRCIDAVEVRPDCAEHVFFPEDGIEALVKTVRKGLERFHEIRIRRVGSGAGNPEGEDEPPVAEDEPADLKNEIRNLKSEIRNLENEIRNLENEIRKAESRIRKA